MGLAVPFMMAAPVSAAPAPVEVSAVELACLAHGFDISTCTHAVTDGVIDVVEDEVNVHLGGLGLDYIVDAGEPTGLEPGEFGYDINEIAVNPLPPLIPVPPVPGIVYE
jgi:hypothetical protein